MLGVGAAQRLRRGLAETYVPGLALGDELTHRPDRLLNRGSRVDAVEVPEVDVVGPKALERPLERAAGVLGRPVEHPVVRIVLRRRGADTELRRDHELLASTGHGLADELLVGVGPVELRGVEEVAAELESALDRGKGLVLVGRTVEGRHPHTPQPELGDGQRSEVARVEHHLILRGHGSPSPQNETAHRVAARPCVRSV